MQENPKLIQAQKEGKVPMEFVPWAPMAAVARVMATGAGKYGANNWLIDHIRARTYVGAIARHALLEWAMGVDVDKDSGEHPLAHVAACCLIVMDAQARNTLIDDRRFAESKAQTDYALGKEPAAQMSAEEAATALRRAFEAGNKRTHDDVLQRLNKERGTSIDKS